MSSPLPNTWQAAIRADPSSWLLEEGDPAVRHQALRLLLARAADDTEVQAARTAAMRTDPIRSILAAQNPAGFWAKPGPGYAPKYRGTVWQLIILDQLGADPNHDQVQSACEYVLTQCQTMNGGFGVSGRLDGPPPPSRVYHCLNGNILRALIGFGRLNDARVQQAIAWQVDAITGEDPSLFHPSGTSGPGFGCAVNESLPCAWGAIKALRGLSRIPRSRRSAAIQHATRQGVHFLLNYEPVAADYPAGRGTSQPSPLWFTLGFPSMYAADVLQNLETLAELGAGRHPRLHSAIAWLLDRQHDEGHWYNQLAYQGRMWVDIDQQNRPSKWVTLRACSALKSIIG